MNYPEVDAWSAMGRLADELREVRRFRAAADALARA